MDKFIIASETLREHAESLMGQVYLDKEDEWLLFAADTIDELISHVNPCTYCEECEEHNTAVALAAANKQLREHNAILQQRIDRHERERK